MRILAVFIFLCSCGFDGFDCPYETDLDGITICNKQENKVDYDILEKTIQIVEEEMQVRYPEVVDFRNTLVGKKEVVAFTDGFLGMKCRPIKYPSIEVSVDAGSVICELEPTAFTSLSGQLIIVEYSRAEEPTTQYEFLAHELIHAAEIYFINATREQAEGHKTPYLFMHINNTACSLEDSVEYKSRLRVIEYYRGKKNETENES